MKVIPNPDLGHNYWRTYCLSELSLFDVGTDYLQAKAIVVPDICMSQEATKARKSDS